MFTPKHFSEVLDLLANHLDETALALRSDDFQSKDLATIVWDLDQYRDQLQSILYLIEASEQPNPMGEVR